MRHYHYTHRHTVDTVPAESTTLNHPVAAASA